MGFQYVFKKGGRSAPCGTDSEVTSVRTQREQRRQTDERAVAVKNAWANDALVRGSSLACGPTAALWVAHRALSALV